MKKYLLHLAPAMVVVAVVITGCGGGNSEQASASSAPADTAAAPAASPSSGSASIRGVATYQNGDPDTAIAMDADPVCASLHPDEVHTEQIVIDDAGNIANVFVYVKEGLSGGGYAIPSESHLLDQVGCQYSPHVSGVMVGQELVIRNSDPTLHNVHAMPSANQEFNSGQPFQGMEMEHKFDHPEVMIPFKCDVHPWMASYMAVLDHPYFGVSAGDGGFSIDDLPAGDYVLEAWHEQLGTQTQAVTVADGESIEVSFDFSPTS